MRIAVFGLGYVGCVTGACLARMGHTVSGVDISEVKVRMINRGHSPIVEKGMERLVARMVEAGRFRATSDPAEAVKGADLSMITVGTPSRRNGKADLTHVLAAARDIGCALRGSKRFHTVVVRSTVPPGTSRGAVLPALARSSGQKAGRGFGVCFFPEFLREGSSIHDFFHPPMNVIGCLDSRSAARPATLCATMRAPRFVTSLEAAEMVKYADNAFHALKVSFANEIGALAKSLGVDGHEVMKIFVRDTKLNISPLYLEPGFAFGGSCLPKDLRALCAMGRTAGVKIPLLENILASNFRHLERAAQLVLATGKKRVGVLGVVFKSDTDDLRESPSCALVKRLLAAKREVRIYDPRVQLDRLIGANRAFVEKELPQLPRLLAPSLDAVMKFGEVIVLAGRQAEFGKGIQKLRRNQILIELVRPRAPAKARAVSSQGICW
jgi:GDP-mannose 6-dehydrogenase